MTQLDKPGARPPRRERVIGDAIVWTSRWSLRWLFIAAGAVVLGLVVRELWSILLPVFLALILSTVLIAPARLLETRLKFPPALASVTVLLGAVAVLVGLGFALAPSVAGQSGEIAADASKGLQRIQDWLEDSDLFTGDQLETAIQAAQDRITSSAGSIAAGVLVGVGAVTGAVINLVLTVVLTFFFLKDGRRFAPWVHRLTGEGVGSHLVDVLGRVWSTLGGFIRTQALVSFIDAVGIGLGLVLVGVPLAIPLAILTFFGGFVPIVGAFVVGAIAVLVALVSVGPTGALIVLAVIIGVQQLEGNVLSPWLQSRSVKLHPVIVLLSVALGGTLFGIVGAFLAVPTAAVLAVIFRYLNELVDEACGVTPDNEGVETEVESEQDEPDENATSRT